MSSHMSCRPMSAPPIPLANRAVHPLFLKELLSLGALPASGSKQWSQQRGARMHSESGPPLPGGGAAEEEGGSAPHWAPAGWTMADLVTHSIKPATAASRMSFVQVGIRREDLCGLAGKGGGVSVTCHLTRWVSDMEAPCTGPSSHRPFLTQALPHTGPSSHRPLLTQALTHTGPSCLLCMRSLEDTRGHIRSFHRAVQMPPQSSPLTSARMRLLQALTRGAIKLPAEPSPPPLFPPSPPSPLTGSCLRGHQVARLPRGPL